MVLGLLENRIDIIVRLPHPRDALVVVAEAILEDELELDEHNRLGRLFVDLGPHGKPGAFSQQSECLVVLLGRAVKACKRVSRRTHKERKKEDVLVALRMYADSALESASLNVDKILSHMSDEGLFKLSSTVSLTCFLIFLCTRSPSAWPSHPTEPNAPRSPRPSSSSPPLSAGPQSPPYHP